MNSRPKKSLSVVSWNVRGLGETEKCDELKLAFPPALSLVCLQETKLQTITPLKERSFLPASFANSFVFMPALAPREASSLLGMIP